MDVLYFRKQYEENRAIYERFTNKLHLMIEELFAIEGIRVALIESRTKDIEGFVEKINRPGKNYTNPLQEITDLSGIRIVLYSLEDVEKVSSLINGTFKVDKDRSINKSNILEADKFGYVSQHYIVKISDSRSLLFEWKDFRDLWAEIQVRTVLQHAWAVIQHSLDYKSKNAPPKQLRRRLFRLSALFELADQELNFIIEEAQNHFEKYKEQIELKDFDIELNADSLKAYLITSETIREWTEYIKSLGFRVEFIGAISRDIDMARKANITTISEIDNLLKSSKGWGERFFQESLNYSDDRNPVVPNLTSLDINGIVTYLLIANFLEVFSDKTLDREFGFGLPERLTVPARKYNPKYQT